MPADAPAPIVVVAALIERDGCILVSRRLKGTHLEGLWEFPGGKCEPGEAHDACLARELEEELGVQATVGPEILVIEHTYPERTVRLHFRACSISADPASRLGQDIKWVRRNELNTLSFPEADTALIKLLTRPWSD